MKTIKRIILLVALTLAAYAAHAQSGYYHQVGDTVRGKCHIYQYEQGWWPVLNAIGHTDSVIGTIGTFGYMKHTTNTPLKVIGVASTVARLDRTTMQEDLDTSIDGTLYYVLCDATAGGLVELARVRWTDDYATHPKRYMELPRRGGAASCDEMLDFTAVVPLREYYFDSAITVTDSFYLGCATTDPTVTDFNSFSYIASHMWDYCTYAVSPDGTPNPSLKSCEMEVPEFTYYDSSRLDNQWHYYTHKRFLLVFPIIEVDTFCVTPDEPQVAYRDSLVVRVEWLDTTNFKWQVSRTAPGEDPDSGLITMVYDTYIEYTDINDDSAYNVYVRGYCETGIWSGWSDWSTPCFIDSIPTPPTPPDPPEGITAVETADFTLSPNPATHQVSIECAETISEAWLTDLTGRREQVRLTAEAPGRYTLDLTARPQATYLLTLTTASGKTHTVRLLKQSDLFSR